MRTILKWVAGLVVVAGALAGASVGATRYFAPPRTEVPTILARRGEFLVETHTRGALRSVKSGMAMAPSVGGTLMITDLKPAGEFVHKDDIVVAFDREDLQNQADEAKSR